MYDFLRVASAVPKVLPGDTAFNTNEILGWIKKASAEKIDILAFPELAITGYTCADLFFQTELLEGAREGLKKILESVGDIIVVVGMPLVIRGKLYNTGVIIYNGRVYGVVPKTYLPNYKEFYEKRWFSSATELNCEKIKASEIGIDADYDISVIPNAVFNIGNRCTFGVEICEDLFCPIPPSSYLSLNGAELIINMSASSEAAGKRRHRERLVKAQSDKCIAGYVYCSAGCDESTSDAVFSGHSIIAENGEILAENCSVCDTDYMIFKDIDLGKIKADRLKITSFRDAAAAFGKLKPAVSIEISKALECCGEYISVNNHPFIPEDEAEREELFNEIFDIQVEGLKKRLELTRTKPVIGVSGGLDSTLALLVAVTAIKRLKMPLSDVWGITMPCFGTTDRTYQNSLELMRTLGISQKEIDIKNAVKVHFEDIGHDGKTPDLTFENAQARERTQVLMDFSGTVGGIVVGTGDLSELALGWCTYNGDHMSMYGVNAGVPKTLIRPIIGCVKKRFPESIAVLEDILDTPISPELLPPDKDGKMLQKTESVVGPYILHDFFIYYMLRYGFSPDKIYYLSKKAFSGEFSEEEILKWLKVFYRRFFTQQFKRNCQPDGVKAGNIGLSPRGDFRMPSDASFNLWLKKLEEMGD